jgi:hypothetical protein
MTEPPDEPGSEQLPEHLRYLRDELDDAAKDTERRCAGLQASCDELSDRIGIPVEPAYFADPPLPAQGVKTWEGGQVSTVRAGFTNPADP